MRTKREILHSSLRALDKIPIEGKVMVEHEHLFLEVWIDIRDLLKTFTEQHKDHWELYHPPKGGEVDDKY